MLPFRTEFLKILAAYLSKDFIFKTGCRKIVFEIKFQQGQEK